MNLTHRIGIDPDVTASGVAYIEQGKVIELLNLDLTDLFAYLDSKPDAFVCISAGWLNKKAVFYAAKNKAIAGRQGVQVGRNHEIGLQIEKYCLKKNRAFKLVRPMHRKWDAVLFRKVTGWMKRTNQEMRDAAVAAM